MLKILIIIYIGVFIVISFISLFYYISQKGSNRNIINKTKKYLLKEKNELSYIEMNKEASLAHISYLTKQLKKNNNLQAFENMLNKLLEEDAKEAYLYIYSITLVFSNIVKKFYKKKNVYKAYYAYLIGKFPLNTQKENVEIRNFLIYLCNSNSIYCRENALRALAMIKDARAFYEGVNVINKSDHLIQVKLLSETLFSFGGNSKELLNLFFDNFAFYQANIKVSIINYARMISPYSVSRIYEFLQHEENEEIIYSCLRYFTKYKYDLAFDYIISLGEKSMALKKWGYVAVIASCLVKYQNERSIKFLCKAVCSEDWQCRENAAKSLIKIYGNKALDIVQRTNDAYAYEMVNYQLNSLDLKKESD